MSIDTQFKINSNINYIRFLRDNPIWYKILNRDPLEFGNFIKEVKDSYKLNPSDRINKMLDNLNMIQSFLDVLK